MSLPGSLGPIARLLQQEGLAPVCLSLRLTERLQCPLLTQLRVFSSQQQSGPAWSRPAEAQYRGQSSCRQISTEVYGSNSLEFFRVGDSAVVQPPKISNAQGAGSQQHQGRPSYDGTDAKQRILHAALKRVVSKRLQQWSRQNFIIPMGHQFAVHMCFLDTSQVTIPCPCLESLLVLRRGCKTCSGCKRHM